MSGDLQTDTSNKIIQVFAPVRVEAISNGVPWTPDGDDRVFMATTDVGMSINGGTSVDIPSHLAFGKVSGATYTFNDDVKLLVM